MRGHELRERISEERMMIARPGHEHSIRAYLITNAEQRRLHVSTTMAIVPPFFAAERQRGSENDQHDISRNLSEPARATDSDSPAIPEDLTRSPPSYPLQCLRSRAAWVR